MLVPGSQRAALLDASAHSASRLKSPALSEPAAAAACPGAQMECSSACPRQTHTHMIYSTSLYKPRHFGQGKIPYNNARTVY